MYRLGNALSPVKEKESLLIDLLLRPQAEESDHRIRAVVALRFQPALGGNRRHTGGTLVCLPRRAVARPMRPHRTPCHRRANHRRFATPCGSGTTSHRVRSIRANGGHNHESTDKRAKYPLDPRLKTGVCARNLYHIRLYRHSLRWVEVPASTVADTARTGNDRRRPDRQASGLDEHSTPCRLRDRETLPTPVGRPGAGMAPTCHCSRADGSTHRRYPVIGRQCA